MGRPTKYKESYCEDIIKYFSTEHSYFHEITKRDKKGNEYIIEIEKPNPLPTFEGFAVRICDVCFDTLLEWKKKHKEFSLAYKKAKSLQKDMLIDLASRGLYNSTFAIFTAKNITDMRDHYEQRFSGDKDNPVNINLTTTIKEIKEKNERELQKIAGGSSNITNKS